MEWETRKAQPVRQTGVVLRAQRQTLILRDGRRLGYAEYGHPRGWPLLVLHGMPGSRLMASVLSADACALGVRLIAPDRPGYGLSSPHPTQLRAYPDDVAQLATALDLARFAVLGVSGGAPYALACAAGLPQRVSRVGLASGLGPLALQDVTAQMAPANRWIFRLGRLSPSLVGLTLRLLTAVALRSARPHLRNGTAPTPALSPLVFATIMADQREAVRSGGSGVAADMRALWQPWGFELAAVGTPVFLWHGEADTLAPSTLAHYVADHLPHCQATFYAEEDHLQPLLRHPRDILRALLPGATSDRDTRHERITAGDRQGLLLTLGG